MLCMTRGGGNNHVFFFLASFPHRAFNRDLLDKVKAPNYILGLVGREYK